MSENAPIYVRKLNEYCLQQGWISRKNAMLGSASALKQRLGRSDSFWSDLLRGQKSFSSDLAREIEKGLGLAKYYLEDDETHSPFEEVKRVNAAFSAGPGAAPDLFEEIGTLSFRRDFLAACGVSPENAKVVDVKGYSMEPTIPNGAVLLINTANTEPRNNTIFALVSQHRGLVVKRLVKKGEDWFARSDNPDGNPEFQINDGEPVKIIGRAVWMGSKL